MKDPETKEEWQAAVDCAHAALTCDAARQYGLVTGGPKINVQRCEDLLRRGAARGITPNPTAIEDFVAAVNSQ